MVPFIIVNTAAKLFKLGLAAPAVVKTVQVNHYSLRLQCREFIKKIIYPAVINRVRNRERNDMEMFAQQEIVL